jgi:hypothetical protein
VRVAFADGELSFTLSKDATFEDLADQLRDLDERPHGKPVTIEVKLAFARCPATSPSSGGLVAVSAPPPQRGDAQFEHRPSGIRNLKTRNGSILYKYDYWFR